jgi:alpha-mannosidase
MTIKEFLIINHTHTDFGYTDHADTLFRHQNLIIDDALDLIEEEQGRGEDSKFRWTCEVTYITANWFRHASERQKERFRDFYNRGLIAIGAMPVHWTPLISPANAIRSLKHLHFLKSEGVGAHVAIQCDVNGLGWFWTDLLLDMGVDSFLLAPNPHRGMRFNDMQRVFNWQSPSGRDLFTVHGWHYSIGVNTFFFGDNDMERTQTTIDRVLGELDKRGQYPYPTAIMPITNPAAPDNGFATRGISDFIERWNAEGRSPKLRMATIDQAMDGVRAAVKQSPAKPETHRGDWSDFWVDGVGSTAYETMLARSAERLLPVVDLLSAFAEKGDETLLERAADEIQLYDEHTWGAFCSISKPDSPFTRIQLNWKTSRAHNGFALAQETVRNEAIKRTREVADGKIEGDYRLRRVDRAGDKGMTSTGLPMRAEEQSYYVLNPSSVPRSVYWPVIRDHAGSSPQTILDAHISEQFLTGMTVRDTDQPSQTHVIAVDLPPFGEAVVKPVPAKPADGLDSGPGFIENDRYRLEIDAVDGSIKSLRDKAADRECVSPQYPLGQVVYETLEKAGMQRHATFGGNYDWSRMETVVWPKTTKYARRTADTVAIGTARQNVMGIEIPVELSWYHGDKMKLTYRLPHHGPGIEMDTLVHKQPIETPESFYVKFGMPGASPRISLDVGDHLIDPAGEQVPLSCEAWLGIQGFAAIATDAGALVVAAPDAPLVQPFGIQTGNVGSGRQGDEPSLAFWTLNNHWDTNFAASQTGRIPARFRLLPQAQFDAAEARAFAETTGTAPVVVRAYASSVTDPAALIDVDADGELTARVRKAWEGGGLVLTLVNPTGEAIKAKISLPQHGIGSAHRVDPLEQRIEGGALDAASGAVAIEVAAGATEFVHFVRA